MKKILCALILIIGLILSACTSVSTAEISTAADIKYDLEQTLGAIDYMSSNSFKLDEVSEGESNYRYYYIKEESDDGMIFIFHTHTGQMDETQIKDMLNGYMEGVKERENTEVLSEESVEVLDEEAIKYLSTFKYEDTQTQKSENYVFHTGSDFYLISFSCDEDKFSNFESLMTDFMSHVKGN